MKHQLPRHVGAIWVDVFIPTYSVTELWSINYLVMSVPYELMCLYQRTAWQNCDASITSSCRCHMSRCVYTNVQRDRTVSLAVNPTNQTLTRPPDSAHNYINKHTKCNNKWPNKQTDSAVFVHFSWNYSLMVYQSINQSINVMTNAGSAEPLCPYLY